MFGCVAGLCYLMFTAMDRGMLTMAHLFSYVCVDVLCSACPLVLCVCAFSRRALLCCSRVFSCVVTSPWGHFVARRVCSWLSASMAPLGRWQASYDQHFHGYAPKRSS